MISCVSTDGINVFRGGLSLGFLGPSGRTGTFRTDSVGDSVDTISFFLLPLSVDPGRFGSVSTARGSETDGGVDGMYLATRLGSSDGMERAANGDLV